ncbi:hypothetical protein ASPCADRAFT_11157 [Aspergillus carbonarius ITEM 5010]|uniref:Uncharacterized protein n=1 Tax=Aspergillus carbonarius (strain ITEM 5010) TaxID=602072 RepID=A0A1R3R611_ASPC5|nr:hypothetical protein ASPCADRAFT_11157 [Aspergillus carbonarius ITEM 5010]
MTAQMRIFALLCQAARLLGSVLRHVSNEAGVHDDSRVQLDRALQSMLAAGLDVDSPDYDRMIFVYRSYFDSSLDGTDAVKADQAQCAKRVAKKIPDNIRANLVEQQCFFGRDPIDMSPRGLFYAYGIVAPTCTPQDG